MPITFGFGCSNLLPTLWDIMSLILGLVHDSIMDTLCKSKWVCSEKKIKRFSKIKIYGHLNGVFNGINTQFIYSFFLHKMMLGFP